MTKETERTWEVLRQRSHRVLNFLVVQLIKTLRNPSRILYFAKKGALWILVSIFRSLPRWLERWPLTIAAQWLGTSAGELAAAANYEEGCSHLDRNDPTAAWSCFRRCLETSTDTHHYFVAGVCLMVGLGRFQEAMAIFTCANALRRRKMKALKVANSRLRFLPYLWVGNFGHLAQMDYYIKREILEGRARSDTIFYLSPYNRPPNSFFFEQWRPFITVIEDEAKLPLPLASLNALAVDFLAPHRPDGSTVHLWEIAADTYRRWEAEGRRPLLKFPAEIAAEARELLAQAGMPRDAWFVALHVREAGPGAHHADLHYVLNARIADYMSAIKEITERGGWVIRMGDPKMTPLEPMANVLDYCHSAIRSDWMDVFLLGNCRFFLGTSSGPAYVPPAYGVPCVLTNWWPPAQRPWHSSDIFMPKLYKTNYGEPLSLAKSLQEPFGYCNSVDYLEETQAVHVEDNSPADIRLAVIEMFERLEKSVHYDDEIVDLRSRADRIYRTADAHGMAQLARDFLKKNKALVD